MGSLKHVPAVLYVGLGAVLGTFARAALENAFPHPADGWPIATLLINVAGSMILGFLLTSLVNSGDDTGWRYGFRLFAGTGMIGGFTTYSTFILEIHSLSLPSSVLYGAVSLILGLACAAAGIGLAHLLVPRKRAA